MKLETVVTMLVIVERRNWKEKNFHYRHFDIQELNFGRLQRIRPLNCLLLRWVFFAVGVDLDVHLHRRHRHHYFHFRFRFHPHYCHDYCHDDYFLEGVLFS